MLIYRTLGAFLPVLVVSTSTAAAQRSEPRLDSARAQIHTSLRAFYFNLAHQDWEALTADILAAKVVAHRPAPDAMVIAAADRASGLLPAGDDVEPCSSGATALVDRATIALDGDWAEVSVPRCSAGLSGADEFRLIRFEARWRIVYIDLFREPVNVSADR
jgi:hypothetical protein